MSTGNHDAINLASQCGDKLETLINNRESSNQIMSIPQSIPEVRAKHVMIICMFMLVSPSEAHTSTLLLIVLNEFCDSQVAS